MKALITEKQYISVLLSEDILDCENSLKSKEGLNNRFAGNIFKLAIDKMLLPHKTKWKGDREMYVNILNSLGKSQSEIEKILDMSFVYDDNDNWQRINKLNTNYTDISTFVIDVLKGENYDLCEVNEKILQGDKSDLIGLSKKIEMDPEYYYSKYLMTNPDKYVQNNTTNSLRGDNGEKMVIKFLEEKGAILIYQSTEGSPIDTKLGIDIIMITKDGKLAKIQVKIVSSIKRVNYTPCEETGMTFTFKKKRGGYMVYSRGGVSIRPNEINRVAYVTDKGDILIVRKYSPVTISNNKCIDVEDTSNFPSNPRGSFYVDYESVTSTNII